MPQDDVTILLSAKDEATAKINQLQARLDKMHAGNRKMAADAAPTFALGKALAYMSAVEGVAKAGTAASAAFRGEWDKAADTIKTLPAGIGAAASAIEGLLGELTGANAEMEKLNAQAAEIARIDAARSGANVKIKSMLEELRLKAQIANADTELEKTQLKLGAEHTKRLRQLKAELETIRELSPAQRRQIEEIKSLLADDLWNSLAEANDKVVAANLAAAEKLAEEARKAAEEQFRKSQELADLDAEIAAAKLKAIGDEEQAEIESIKRRYARRIAEAERAGELEKAIRLKTLLDLDLAEAQSQRKTPTGPSQIGALAELSSRFARRASGYGTDDPVAKNTAKTAQSVQALGGKLDRVADVLERNKLLVAEGWGL